jgi:aminoglycoside 6'-N-acetyltransferase I
VEVQVIRVQSGNLAILENVDPECFDEPIDMNRAACCVASPDVVLVAAVAAGTVIGQCLAMIHRHPDKPTEIYLDDLAVSPRFRRRGIATRLVETCMLAGREAGAHALWVATEADNRVANDFYRALRLVPRPALIFEGSR